MDEGIAPISLIERLTPACAAEPSRYRGQVPLRNRVTPLGELVADPAHGLVYGNRGCLHDEHGTIRRRYAGKRWIACRLEFRGWKRKGLLQPGRFTELFFLDEATAFASGHRPCALCRHEDYRTFVTIWQEIHPGDDPVADAIDARLHLERIEPGTRAQRRYEAPFDGLPDGSFVLREGAPCLVVGDRLLRWTAAGYEAPLARPRGRATALTPPSLVAVLRAGWQPLVPLLHPSVRTRETG